MNKKTLCVIMAIVSMFVTVAMTPRVIVIDSKPMAVNEIDSITFDVATTPPLQKVWKGGFATTMFLSDGASVPLLSDVDLGAGIYRIANPSEEWDLMYVTPIGYFFRCNPANIEGDVTIENNNEIDDNNRIWYYESFDALRTALIQVYGIGWTKTMDYGKGETDYFYSDSITVITHETEGFQREIQHRGCYYCPSEEIENDELRLSLYLHTINYDQYNYEVWEGELQQLIVDFASLVKLPVQSKDVDIAIKNIAQGIGTKIKKYHDRNFAIVPRTGIVYDRDIYDCSVKHIYGRIYTASSNFLKEAEYGILVDKDPQNLTTEKAEMKVQLTQQSIVSDFNAYLSNLQPGTKYYYCTYCKIPKNRLDTYHFRYGDKNATIGYGKVKYFNTKTALLVNVEIKNDGRNIFNDRQALILPLCVSNITYEWNKDKQMDEFNYDISLDEVPDGFSYNSYACCYIQEGSTKYEFLDITFSSDAQGESMWRCGFRVSHDQIEIDLLARYTYYNQQKDGFRQGSVLTHLEDYEGHDLGACLIFSQIMNENWHTAQESEVGYNYILTQGVAPFGFGGCFCHNDWGPSTCSATLADFYAIRDVGSAKSLIYKKNKDGKIEKETSVLFDHKTHNNYGDDIIYRECEQASMSHIESIHNTLKVRAVYVGEKRKNSSLNIAKARNKIRVPEGGIGSPMVGIVQCTER